MIRRFLIFSIWLLGSISAVLLLSSSASAIEKQYYWHEGESGDLQIIIKHPYFQKTEECRKNKEKNEPCNEGAVFKLDRNTRDHFRFVSEGNNDTIQQSGVNSRCVFYRYYIDVAFEGNTTKAVEGVRVPDGHSAASVHDAGNAVHNEACQKSFKGWTSTSHGLTNDLHHHISNSVGDLKEPFTITGTPGQDGNLSALEDQLARMYDREKTHFVHRVCSTHKDAGTPGFNENDSNCKKEDAEKAYKIVWDYCSYKIRTLSNNNERTAQLKSCIQEQSGVSINGGLVDSTTFNLLTYADGASCSIRFIGWIVCPLSRFLASVTDAAFDGLSRFLTIRPLNRGEDAGDALYSAWQLVNNLANVIFIITFILIILSQVMGWGMSNYSIKRLLPRLILTAILVNISYYLCVVAVDVSNILGKSLIDIISTLEPDAVNKPSTWTQEVENILVFTAGATGVGMLLLTGSIVAMVPLLVGAALSFLVAIIMIVARYALVVILIIIAPFAIALSLLPNTQKWYQQWYKLFLSMLLLFPMISIVFGTAKIAGILVLNSSLARSTGDITLQLFGLAIQALPLALTPLLMKLSGGVLNRFGGMVSSRGFFGKTKERAENFAQRKKDARDVKGLNNFGANKRGGLAGLRDSRIQGRYRRTARHALNEQELNRGYADYISGYTSGKDGSGGDQVGAGEQAKAWALGKAGRDYSAKNKGEKFAENLAKGGGSLAQVKADAINAQININTEEVKAAKARLRDETGMNMSQYRDLASNQATPEAIRQAAIEMVTEGGSIDDINAVVKSSGSMSKTQRQVLAKGVSSGRVAGQAAYYGSPAASNAILSGQVNSDDTFTQHIVAASLNSSERTENGTSFSTGSEISAERIGTMHDAALQEVRKALDSGHVREDAIQAVSDAAKAAQSSSSIQSKSHGTQQSIQELNNIARYR